MPSKTKAQAILFAMADHNPAFAKKRGIPQSVAHEFNQADKRTGILRRAGGGATPMEMGMDAQMNNGQGHGHNFFSTTPLMGHAMSGMPLGGADKAIRNAQSTLARFRFAEGGKVAKPAPSAKERREIRDLIARGKDDAIAALRAGRDALMEASPQPAEEDPTTALDRLRRSLAAPPVSAPLAMADGGEVNANADPEMLYEEYTELLAQLSQGDLDERSHIDAVDRMAEIEQQLEALGLDVGGDEGAPPTE